MVVLSRVLEAIGVSEKVSKGQATKMINKAGFEKDENGAISTEDAITTLTIAYGDEKSGSKFAEAGRKMIETLKAGKITEAMKEPEVKAAPKADAFLEAKVMKVVRAVLEEKGSVTLEEVANITKELEAAKAAKI
jgi:hypothetical protein